MQDLKITIIQTDLFWENKEKNLENFSKIISSISETADIIVLPEMFNTGFAMNTEKLAEKQNDKTIEWMKETAKNKNCAIAGSLIIKERNKFFNRLIWMKPNGEFEKYDKRHLFRMSEEHNFYSAGKNKIIINHNGWKICPLICYDLRFPVWSRNKFNKNNNISSGNDYDCLIYIANWPEARNYAWKTLLVARAIENQSYVVGVDRIGTDGKNINYSGDSMVIDSYGKIISNTKPHETSVETITLSYSKLEEHRKAFSVSLDSDEFILRHGSAYKIK